MDKLIALLAVAALCVTGSANAQVVYRCVEKGKPVSLQSDPCPAQAQVTKVREFVPQADVPVRRVEAQRPAPASSAPQPRWIQQDAPQPYDECAAAKAERDAWERRVGLSRTYDQLRAMNDMVARACR